MNTDQWEVKTKLTFSFKKQRVNDSGMKWIHKMGMGKMDSRQAALNFSLTDNSILFKEILKAKSTKIKDFGS